MGKEIEALGWVFYVITVILLLAVIGMLFWKLSGHSPTEINILLWMVGILVSLQTLVLMAIFDRRGKIGEFLEFRRQTIEEIKEIKSRLKS